MRISTARENQEVFDEEEVWQAHTAEQIIRKLREADTAQAAAAPTASDGSRSTGFATSSAVLRLKIEDVSPLA